MKKEDRISALQKLALFNPKAYFELGEEASRPFSRISGENPPIGDVGAGQRNLEYLTGTGSIHYKARGNHADPPPRYSSATGRTDWRDIASSWNGEKERLVRAKASNQALARSLNNYARPPVKQPALGGALSRYQGKYLPPKE